MPDNEPEAGRGDFARIAGAALPLYLTMITASAAALVDTAVLGHQGAAELAAFAVTMAVFGPVIAVVSGVLRGLMPIVAEYAEDPDALLPVVRNGLWVALTVGGAGAGAVAAVPLLGRLGGVPDGTLDRLGSFPCLLAGSVLVTAIGASAGSVLIGLGRGRAVMRAGLYGTGTAVVLSLLLVRGQGPVPSLGLPGAGLAMLASGVIGAAVGWTALRRAIVSAGRRLRPGRPDPREMARCARIGLPLAGTVLIKFAVLGALSFAAARIDTTSAAVHSVCVSLVNVLFTVAVAVGQASVPLVVGHAANRDTMATRRVVRHGAGVALCAVAILAAVLVAFHTPIVSIFTDDERLRSGVVGQLPVLLVVVVADALQAVYGFGLIGLQRTMPSFWAFACCYGLLVAAAVPLAAAGGLGALWSALACANLVLLLAQAASFHRFSGTPAGART
ncbi:MATE family efflux transporter [Embleya sp. NPDC005971]|uniref:MATE family efflux transporter n=1 Tax=unclassified Embleya TaxID=2699296 RepID=UPI0033FECA31